MVTKINTSCTVRYARSKYASSILLDLTEKTVREFGKHVKSF